MGLAKLKSKPYYTIDQYLAWERQADEKSEFVDGEIYAMAGESGSHADISMNLAMTLGTQVRGTKCRARTKNSKVRSGAINEQLGHGMISYPDMVVICGEVEYHDTQKDVILNPKVILEVLSDSTEQFDRGTKFTRYRNFNPTLTDYILSEYDGLDKSFEIGSINCTISLSEIYDRVDFE